MIHLNIFHRFGTGALPDVFKQQQDLVHSLGLKSTVYIITIYLWNQHKPCL